MRLTLFLSLLFFSFSLFAESFKNYEVLVPAANEKELPTILVLPIKLLPTQIAIGQMTVSALVSERFGEKVFLDLNYPWDKNLTLEENLKKFKPEQLKKYIESIQTKMNKKAFEGAYTNSGIFHFDGHHRSRALYEVNEILAKISPDEKLRVFIPVKLVADYSVNFNDRQIAKDIFLTKAQGYVPLSVFKTTPKVKAQELALLKYFYLKKHAPNLGALVDDPYRSLIGQALYEEKIDSDSFVTYFEFYLEELLKSKMDKALSPIEVKAGMKIEAEMVNKVKSVLFSDPKVLDQIAYWARFGNLSKEEAFKRCLLLVKKKDSKQSAQELDDEKICQLNKKKLYKVQLEK